MKKHWWNGACQSLQKISEKGDLIRTECVHNVYGTTACSSYTGLHEFEWRWCNSSNKSATTKEQWLLLLYTHTYTHTMNSLRSMTGNMDSVVRLANTFSQAHAILLIILKSFGSQTSVFMCGYKRWEVFVMYISVFLMLFGDVNLLKMAILFSYLRLSLRPLANASIGIAIRRVSE